MALTINVSPVSSIVGNPGGRESRTQPGTSPNAERISITFPVFVVAIISRFIVQKRRMLLLLSILASRYDLLLYLNQLANAAAAKLQKLVQSANAEGKPLGCSLNLNKLVSVGHDNIEINVGRRILGVIQVQHGNSIDNAHADGRNVGPDGVPA